MLARINYLGYNIYDTDDLKRYFDKHIFLQPDQSTEVLKVFKLMHEDNTISDDLIKSANERAKNYFGVTNDLNLAGYILTDGDLLKLSYDNRTRNIDHRDIDEVLTNIDTSDKQSAAMIEFINYGNIRLMGYNFELSRRPSREQQTIIAALVRKAKRNEYAINIDISNNNGFTVKSFTYDIPIFSEIITDIEDYFTSISI